jgi:SlyX protein
MDETGKCRHLREMEQRIAELELRSMEQQALLQQLSEVLYAQQRELEAVRAQVNLLAKRVQAEPGLVDAKQQERPPHY